MNAEDNFNVNFIDSLHDKIAKQDSSIQDLQNQNRNLKENCESKESQITSLSSQLNECKIQLEQFDVNAESDKRINKLKQQNEKSNNELKSEKNRSKEKSTLLSEENKQLKQNIQNIEKEKQKLNSSHQAEIKSKNNNINSLQSTLNSANEQISKYKNGNMVSSAQRKTSVFFGIFFIVLGMIPLLLTFFDNNFFSEYIACSLGEYILIASIIFGVGAAILAFPAKNRVVGFFIFLLTLLLSGATFYYLLYALFDYIIK